jgi:hypothetical protein
VVPGSGVTQALPWLLARALYRLAYRPACAQPALKIQWLSPLRPREMEGLSRLIDFENTVI